MARASDEDRPDSRAQLAPSKLPANSPFWRLCAAAHNAEHFLPSGAAPATLGWEPVEVGARV
jgi:hypothetical protein